MASEAYRRALAYAQEDAAAAPGPQDTLSDEFSKGLRGAGNAVAGQLNSLAGLTAENLGADEFAAGRRAAAADYMRRSEELGQGAVSFKDIGSGRDALRWGARTAGSVLPYLGASVAGTVVAKNPFIGSAAPMMPISAGSIVQRQEADPESMQDDASTRLRNAAIGGVAAGAASALPFGVAAGKLTSGALMGAGKNVLPAQSLLGALGKNVGQGAVTAGAGMGVGNVIEQGSALGFDRVNPKEALDATIEGAAMGGLMGLPFVPGSYVRGRGEQAAQAGKDLLGRTKEGAEDTMSEAQRIAQAAGKMAGGYWDAAKDKMPDSIKDRVESVAKFTQENYAKGRDAMRQTAKDLMESEDVPGDLKKGLKAAYDNIHDKVNFSFVEQVRRQMEEGRKAKVEEPKAPQPLDALNKLADADRSEDMELDSIAKGEPIGGVKPEMATADDATIMDYMKNQATSTTRRIKETAKRYAEDMGLDENVRKNVNDMLAEAGDEIRNRSHAALLKSIKASSDFADRAGKFVEGLRKTDDGVKKSEDLTGFENALRDSVIPYMKKNMPELFSTNPNVEARDGQVPLIHPSNFNRTRDALNHAMTEMSQGTLTSDRMMQLIELFGSHTMPIMERLTSATGRTLTESGRVYKGDGGARTNGKGAMGENNTMRAQLENLMRDREGVESDPYTQQFLELARLSNKQADIEQIVRQGLRPEYQDMSTAEVNRLIKAFDDWANGNHLSKMIGARGAKAEDKGTKAVDPTTYLQTEKGRLQDARIREEFNKYFGKDGEATERDTSTLVSKAFEDRAERKFRDEPTIHEAFDADGNRIAPEELDRVVRGLNYDTDKFGNKVGVKLDDEGKVIRGRVGNLSDRPKPLTPEQIELYSSEFAKKVAGDKTAFNSPEYREAETKIGGFSPAQRLLLDMQHEFPTHDVKWEAKEGSRKGYVVAERASDPNRFSHNDIQQMLAHNTVGKDGKSRMRASDIITVFTDSGTRIEIDSMLMSRIAEKNIDKSGRGESTSIVRAARGAADAVAQLYETFGGTKEKPRTINIKDDANVAYLGRDKDGEPRMLTWGEAQRVISGNSGKSFTEAEAGSTKKAWKDMTTAEKAAEVENRRRAEATEMSISARNRAENKKAKAMLFEGKPEKDGDGPDLRTERLEDEMAASGQYDQPNDANIHALVAVRGEGKRTQRTSNEDGTASTNFKLLTGAENERVNGPKGLRRATERWYEEGEHADVTVDKTNILIDYALNAMSGNDLRTLLNLRNVSEVRKAEGTVGELYSKYYGALPESVKNLPMEPLTAKKGRPLAAQQEVGMPLKDGAPITVKKTAAEYGKPVAFPVLQMALKKYLTPTQARIIGDAANTKNFDKEIFTKEGKFYIQEINGEAVVQFAPVAKGKKGNFVGSAKRAEFPETGTFTALEKPEPRTPQGELFGPRRNGIPGTESYGVPGKADATVAPFNERKAAVNAALKPIEARIDAIRREYGNNPYAETFRDGRTKVTVDGYPPDILREYEQLQDAHAAIRSTEGLPDPKVLAAKKAALLEAASSSNPDLFRELSTSTDVKALQRAVDTLTEQGGVLESRSTIRAEMLAGNPYRGDITTLSHMLKVMSKDPEQFLGKGVEFSRENFRNHPEVQEAMKELLAGRLRGDPDASRALDTFRHVEYQHFSLGQAKATNAAISERLNTFAKTPLSSLLDTIANGNDVPLVLREIAAKVKEAAGKVTVYSKADMGNAMGEWVPSNNTINIDKGYSNLASVVLHEGVHAATVRAIAKNEGLNRAIHELMEHVAFVSKRTANAYGLTDSAEFLAEGLSNREFQKELQGIIPSSKVRKYLGDNVANAWDAFVSLVRQALKLEQKHESALSQLFELAGHAMKETAADKKKGYTPEEAQVWHDRLYGSMYEYRKAIEEIKTHLSDSDAQGRADFDALLSRAEANQGVTYAEQHTAEAMAFALKARLRDEGMRVFHEEPGLSKVVAKGIEEAALGADGRKFPSSGIDRAIDTANKRISELLKKDENLAYGMQLESKYSLANNTGGPHGPLVEAEIQKLATKMLGPTVKAVLADLGHAGEYWRDPKLHVDVLRVSKTAMDPLGVTHHEALHAFFGHLRAAKMNDVTQMLEKYSASAHIMDQFRERFAGNAEVMKQLADPEERAAYMFQLYKTDPTFKLAPSARSLFGKLSDMFHKVLGIWTNHERAQHIMDYFERGEFATDMAAKPDLSLVHQKLMLEGRNKALEKLKDLAAPMARLGEGVIGIGGHRLRDTGIPALGKIADLVKSTGRGAQVDRGFLSAAREVRAQHLNEFAKVAKKYTEQEHREALEAMQNGKVATGNAGIVQKAAQAILDKAFDHMTASGVDIKKFQDPNGAAYFPRVWDPVYISKNQDAFIQMLEKYTRSGEFAGDPAEVMRTIMSNEGSSFNVVTRQPGMQFKKERMLRFIDHADAAPFLQKDLMMTIDSYVTQAARRAEWSKRFGDDAKKLEDLFAQAKKEGATDAQIMTAETYLKGVDGTLGDSIDPSLRRLQGNTIVYQNIRLLPLAIFSSMVDPLGIAVRGGGMKAAFGAFKRGFKEIPEGFRSERKGSAEERTAELLGVIDDAYLQSNLGALYNQGMAGDFGRKLNDKFFKYNLMEQWNRSMRSAATAAAIKFIEAHADGVYNAKHSVRWMQELGLEVGKIERRPDGSLKLFESDGLTKEQAQQIRSAINQWVDGAVLRPDAADKPIWMNDPHFALLAHLKQFTWSFQETILKRVIHEYQHGNVSPALALASYVPMMIAADAAKGMIQGGGSQPSWKEDWGMEDYIASGVQRAGLFGVGQYGIDAISSIREGGTGLGALVGPTYEQLGDAVYAIGGPGQFSSFALKSMPANSIYSDWVRNGTNPETVPAD